MRLRATEQSSYLTYCFINATRLIDNFNVFFINNFLLFIFLIHVYIKKIKDVNVFLPQYFNNIELSTDYLFIQIIPTDKFPVKLQYMEHLDQVWVLCWGQAEDTGSKTAVVIRQASQDIQHHTVHTQPIGNRFDLVCIVFVFLVKLL